MGCFEPQVPRWWCCGSLLLSGYIADQVFYFPMTYLGKSLNEALLHEYYSSVVH
jgi:hypothetical protein